MSHETEHQPLTWQQQSRLERFEHLNRQIKRQETIQAAGKPMWLYYTTGQGQEIAPAFRVDQRVLGILRRTMMNMYTDELAQEPQTREVAEYIVEEIRDN